MKKKCKWLSTFLIFDIEDPSDLVELSIKVDRNLWIGSLMHLPLDSNLNQVIIVAVSRKTSENGNEYQIAVYEKRPTNNLGPGKLKRLYDHGLEGKFPLVQEEGTKHLFKYLNKRYSPEFRMIFTLGHGGLFGINYVDDVFIKELQNVTLTGKANLIDAIEDYNLATEVDSASTILADSFISVFKKQNSNNFPERIKSKLQITDSLSTREFANCLREFEPVDKRKGIDILVIGNCFMQNIFAQYELHPFVDYYVAPIAGISYPGYNFLKVFKEMDYNSNPEHLASKLVESSTITGHSIYKGKTRYREHINFVKTAIDERWFLQAVKLESSTYENIKSLFAHYFEGLNRLVESSSTMKTYVKKAVKSCYKYSVKTMPSMILIDFFVFCSSLKSVLNSYSNSSIQILLDDFNTKSEQLLQERQGIIVNQFQGKHFFDDSFQFSHDKKVGTNNVGFGFLIIKDLTANSTIFELLDPTPMNTKQPSLNENTHYSSFLKNIMGVMKF